ncbi:maleylpyruvate isomerase family mycothiol-dependent enzyme [Streptomyces sp. NPDC058872]|uniref:maleylpyruvate isomerase family mycothiol-dependent enzyme n=1 Tax=Streptomyces sp. NPDC058872 TaxID=3346661 RepID=UPI00368CD95F
MTGPQRPEDFYGTAYRDVRDDVARLLRDRPDAAELPVPACPAWNVRDLVGHLLQVCRRVIAEDPRELPDVPPPEQHRPIGELLSEWASLDGPVREVLDRAPGLRPRIALMDLVSHHLDVRRALDVPLTGDHPAFRDALELVVLGFGLSLVEHGLPALRIETPDGSWTIGEGGAAATMGGRSLDVFRSLTGRRTLVQIGELAWSTPPEPWRPAFAWGPFTPPPRPAENLTSD